jgi:hypothetical protein
MFDVAIPLWGTADTQMAIPTAIKALQEGLPQRSTAC